MLTPVSEQPDTRPRSATTATMDQPTSDGVTSDDHALDQVALEEGAEPWRAQARCADLGGGLTGLFFSEELQDIARAKRICAECPVIDECLDGAMERREPWGVWGGQLLVNGRILANKRRRGRPAKNPRPEDQVPLLPVPVHLRERVVGAA